MFQWFSCSLISVIFLLRYRAPERFFEDNFSWALSNTLLLKPSPTRWDGTVKRLWSGTAAPVSRGEVHLMNPPTEAIRHHQMLSVVFWRMLKNPQSAVWQLDYSLPALCLSAYHWKKALCLFVFVFPTVFSLRLQALLDSTRVLKKLNFFLALNFESWEMTLFLTSKER